MPALWAFAVAGFRRYARYRAATAAGAFTNSIFGLLRAAVVVATVAAGGGSLAGYDAAAASTYAWLSQAAIAPVAIFGWTELAQRVRTGDIAIDLARPVDLQLQLLATDLGRAAFVLLPRGLPPLAVGAVTFGLALPRSPLPYGLGLASLTLGVAISFACRFLANLAAFWLLDVRGVMTLYLVASNVLCGLIVPVHWFPGWLGTLAAGTPFPSMVQAPVDILAGRAEGGSALRLLAVQGLWLAATLLAGRLLLVRATRRLVVQGG